MEVRSMVVNDDWTFDIRRREVDGNPVNNVKWDAKAVDENGAELPVMVNEAGLGRYTASVPLGGKQKLTVRLRDIENNKLKVLHYNRPSPGEYRLGQTVPPALATAPEFTAPTVKANIHPVETRQSVEPWCYFLALACALGSIVLRRV
jgi:hypothetical protein